MALQLRQINARPYARGQEELENRLKKLRKQKDIVAAVIEDMMQRAELVASRVTSVRNLNEFLRQFEAATGSIDEMYMKMFQVHFLLTADDFFGGNAHYLRAPMAITYSVPASTTRNDAQGAPLQAIEGFGSLSSTSRPPSVASPDLSGCDDGLGTYCSASAGRGRELPPPRAPAYTSPGAPSAVGAPHGPTYPVSGAQALLAAPRATLAYGSPGPRQQFAMPPACSGRGAVPKCLSPTPLGYVSPADQFSDNLPSPSMPETRCVSGRGTWPQLPSSPSPVDRSSSVQLRGYGRGVLPKPSPPPTPGYANLRAQPSGSWPEVQSPPTPVCESPEVQSPHTPVCENPETQFMAGSGTVPEVQSPPTLVYGSPGGAEFMAGSGALPKLPSPPTLGYESREAQFMSSHAKLASPPTSSYMSLGAQLTPKPKLTAAQTSSVPSSCTAPSELNLPPATVHTGLMAPPTDRADVGHVEKTLGHSVTPRAKAPVRGAMPVAKGVAPPPVHSATTTPHKSAKGAVKEDVRDRGDVCSVLDEADQGNNSYSQGQGKPAGSKANVPVPPGFTALDRQPEHVVTSVKTRSAGSSSPQKTLNTTMAGSVRSPSPRIGSLMPNSRNYFSIAPADTSVVGSTREVVLSFYKTPSEFSLQLKSSGEVLDSLLNNLTAYYRSNVPPQEFEAMVGMHCVAHYAEDDHWYRARILALEPDHARVLYVDFGNCEHVSLDKLRFLVEQFSSPPAQAYNCSIRVRSIPGGKKTWPLPAVRRFWDMLSVPETKLEAVFYSKSTMSDSFVVDILGKTGDRPEANLSQQFLCMSKAEGQKSSQASSCAMEIPVAEQPVKVDAPASGPSGCKPRPATGPRAIVRPGSTAEQGAPAASHATASGGAALTVRDGEIGPEPPALADVAPQMVGVPIPPATAILATGPPPTSTPPAFKAAVVAARVGRPQGAPKAVPEVAKPAAAQHPARPPAGIPPAGLLSEGAVARMSHKLSPPDAIHAVLPPDAVPAVPPPLPPLPTVVIPPGIPPAVLPSGKTFTFILSVVFNPSDFYGQILAENGVPEVMKELKQQLNQQGSTSSAPLPELVTKGTFWLCFFEGDKNWYRVQVLDVGNSNSAWRARVLYVDYGNRSVVKLENLRPLPENLARPPARAHRMALAMVSPTQGSKWVNDATQTFVSETGFKTVLVGEKRGRRQAGLETVTDVVVWNKNGETPVNINILLVEKKLAQLKSP